MLRQYRKINKDEFIVCGVDTSVGMNDYCAAQFISKTRLDAPLVYHEKTTATNMTPVLHGVLNRIFDTTGIKPVVAYERQNGGAFEMDRLALLNREGKYTIFRMPTHGTGTIEITPKLGWDTNTATRPQMLQDLKNAIDGQLLRIYDKLTIEELYSFIKVQTTATIKAQAERGAHDDLVMSLAIAWQLYQQCETPIINKTSGIPYNDPKRTWGVYGKDSYE